MTPDYPDLNNFDTMTAYRRLVDDLLDDEYYEPTVHPSIDFRKVSCLRRTREFRHLAHKSESVDEFISNTPS